MKWTQDEGFEVGNITLKPGLWDFLLLAKSPHQDLNLTDYYNKKHQSEKEIRDSLLTTKDNDLRWTFIARTWKIKQTHRAMTLKVTLSQATPLQTQ